MQPKKGGKKVVTTKTKNVKGSKGTASNMKNDPGGQRQKGNSCGNRKSYNEANSRGNLCYGANGWAASNTVMATLQVWLDIQVKPKPEVAKTTDDFILYIKDLISKSPNAGDGYAIGQVQGMTGHARVLAGGRNYPSIGMKCSNLRMPSKQTSHVWLAEAKNSFGNDYHGALLLRDYDIEALQVLGILRSGVINVSTQSTSEGESSGRNGVKFSSSVMLCGESTAEKNANDVTFVSHKADTSIKNVYYVILEAAQCINPNCIIPKHHQKKIIEPIKKIDDRRDYNLDELLAEGNTNSLQDISEEEEEEEYDSSHEFYDDY